MSINLSGRGSEETACSAPPQPSRKDHRQPASASSARRCRGCRRAAARPATPHDGARTLARARERAGWGPPVARRRQPA